ncbi:PilW family protein [Halofilum ochraceum]|uniref:PilW family protein n=1 Tax=Halofilum ochraceum TaxID=1611323 RepID=UPI0008DABCE8|nr:PilW family protein [Halofilum ochraceum]
MTAIVNRYPQHQRGLTLVEIMVALLISTILGVGVVQIFSGSKRTYDFQQAQSRIQENGRYILEAIARDLRMLDYNSCAGRTPQQNSTLNATDDGQDGSGEEALIGYVYADGDWDVTPNQNAGIGNPMDPSHALELERPADGMVQTTDHQPSGASVVLFVNDPGSIQVCDIVQVTNCRTTTTTQITNIPASGNQLQTQTSGCSPGNATQNLGDDFSNAQVMQLSRRTYYVDDADGDGYGQLMRVLDNGSTTDELVEGIHDLEFEYGVDSNDDKQIESYEDPGTISDWSEVIAVRMMLTMVSRDDVLDEPHPLAANNDDLRLYHVFNRTVTLRNRMP